MRTRVHHADELAREIGLLGRWMDGRFVTAASPDDEAIPAEHFLDPDVLRPQIARASSLAEWNLSFTGASPDGDDEDVNLKVAVSRFTRHYAASISIAALVGLARGIGFDVSAARCTMIVWRDIPFRLVVDGLDGRDVMQCAERPPAWPVDGPTVDTMAELRAHVWQNLYAGHLGPLFARLNDVTKVSHGLMWTNAAEWVGMVPDAAEEYLGIDAAAPYIAERDALLGAETLPGVPGPNPLADRLDWIPAGTTEFPLEVQTRRICCTTYLLPDRGGRLCQNCPFLPLDERVALMRERHGVPMGSPSGPAELRSIELGRKKAGLAD